MKNDIIMILTIHMIYFSTKIHLFNRIFQMSDFTNNQEVHFFKIYLHFIITLRNILKP